MRLKTLSRQKQRSRGNRNPPNDEILTFTDDTAEKTGSMIVPLMCIEFLPTGRLCQLSTFLLLASNQLPV